MTMLTICKGGDSVLLRTLAERLRKMAAGDERSLRERMGRGLDLGIAWTGRHARHAARRALDLVGGLRDSELGSLAFFLALILFTFLV